MLTDQQKRNLIIGLLGLLLIVGLFSLVRLLAPSSGGDVSVATFEVDDIGVVKAYEDNEHMFSGTIRLPSECYTLRTSALIRESFPEQVTLIFETIPAARDCQDVFTEYPFTLTVEASEEASFDATFNGEDADLEIIEV